MNKFEMLKSNLERFNFQLLTSKNDFHSVKQKVIVSDGTYTAVVRADNYIRNTTKKVPLWFAVKNPYIIDNVNMYYKINHSGNFICVSTFEEIKNRDNLLQFKCTRCGEIIRMSLHNSLKNDISHSGVKCPNCDEHFESLHALVLKQIFKYYYPDTIEEDLSCVNPLTGHILPTDIVNHRLKIAIEVQGQWHRFENQKTRDRIKKDFWMNNGYTFYDYGIDNVSVLDYIKYFFPDLDEIPDWVNMDYNKKINIKKAQELLNLGLSVSGVAEQMNVNIHRIYDAIYSKKLFYPDGYKNASNRSVVMLNRERVLIKEYNSYGTAARDNNIKENLIASCIHSKRYYCKGYYWIPKDLYISGDFTIPENRTDKFFFPVVKYDLDGNIVGTFDDMYQAANDIGTIAYKIYEVIIGTRKTIKNYRYRYK